MLENWAKLAGFSALLAIALSGGLTWLLPNLFLPNPLGQSISECYQSFNQQNEKTAGNTAVTQNPASSVSEQESAQHNERRPNPDDNKKYECLIAAYTAQLASFTEWLAVVTAVLIGVGIYQGVQLKRAVDAAKKSDQILERAYLWPGPGAHKQSQPGRREFFITVHNTGKTAGVITDVYYRLSTEADFTAGNFEFRHRNREDVIPPGMVVGAQKLTGASVEMIGPEPRILHGYIVYTDVFKIRHECPWKHWLEPDGSSDPLPGCYTEWT